MPSANSRGAMLRLVESPRLDGPTEPRPPLGELPGPPIQLHDHTVRDERPTPKQQQRHECAEDESARKR